MHLKIAERFYRQEKDSPDAAHTFFLRRTYRSEFGINHQQSRGAFFVLARNSEVLLLLSCLVQALRRVGLAKGKEGEADSAHVDIK